MFSLNHVGLVVKNADYSREFYENVLGCKMIEEYQDERIRLVFLSTGNGVLELVQYLDKREEQRHSGVVDHIAFKVEDMQEALARVKEQKVTLLFDQPKTVGKKQIFFFTGPDGERLEFVQEV